MVELRPGDAVPEEYVVEHAGTRCMDQRGDGACVALRSGVYAGGAKLTEARLDPWLYAAGVSYQF